MFDPREDRYTELRRRDLMRTAARYRLSRHMLAGRTPKRSLIRRMIVWTARGLVAAGVRLFVLSKSWEQPSKPMYNDISEHDRLAIDPIAD